MQRTMSETQPYRTIAKILVKYKYREMGRIAAKRRHANEMNASFGVCAKTWQKCKYMRNEYGVTIRAFVGMAQ